MPCGHRNSNSSRRVRECLDLSDSCFFVWRFCFCFCSEIQGGLGSGFCQQLQQKKKNSHSCGAFITFSVKKCFKLTCIKASIFVVAGAFIDWAYVSTAAHTVKNYKMISLSSELWVRPMVMLLQQFCAQEVQPAPASGD